MSRFSTPEENTAYEDGRAEGRERLDHPGLENAGGTKKVPIKEAPERYMFRRWSHLSGKAAEDVKAAYKAGIEEVLGYKI